jgi:hypothetical protein
MLKAMQLLLREQAQQQVLTVLLALALLAWVAM